MVMDGSMRESRDLLASSVPSRISDNIIDGCRTDHPAWPWLSPASSLEGETGRTPNLVWAASLLRRAVGGTETQT